MSSTDALSDDEQRFAEYALANGLAREQGDWIQFNGNTCTVRYPQLKSPVPFDMDIYADLFPFFVDDLDYEHARDGCYLNADALRTRLDPSGSADRAKINRNIVAFDAANVISGRATFHSASPLVTPVSFQLLIGDRCEQAPNVQRMAQDMRDLEHVFGEFVRAYGAQVPCGDGAKFDAWIAQPMLNTLLPDAENQWAAFNLQLVFQAAGWAKRDPVDGASAIRPPLCHYPTD
ncbi:MAG: hypothetical protein AAF386_01500 [Pseudomonadota bacterium]